MPSKHSLAVLYFCGGLPFPIFTGTFFTFGRALLAFDLPAFLPWPLVPRAVLLVDILVFDMVLQMIEEGRK
jgi:hypothetical protein